MYKSTKKKIDKLGDNTHTIISNLYEMLTVYELDKSNLDEIIVKLWSILSDSGAGRFDEYADIVTEIFTELLKYFTKNKKGLFEKYQLYGDYDNMLIEGFMCDSYMLKYMTYHGIEMSLSIYRLYMYFRHKKMYIK